MRQCRLRTQKSTLLRRYFCLTSASQTGSPWRDKFAARHSGVACGQSPGKILSRVSQFGHDIGNFAQYVEKPLDSLRRAGDYFRPRSPHEGEIKMSTMRGCAEYAGLLPQRILQSSTWLASLLECLASWQNPRRLEMAYRMSRRRGPHTPHGARDARVSSNIETLRRVPDVAACLGAASCGGSVAIPHRTTSTRACPSGHANAARPGPLDR